MLAGYYAGSIALVGFGFDSAIESFSGVILIWMLKRRGSGFENEKLIENRAERLVGLSFLVLGAYVLYESVSKIYFHEIPGTSLPGLIVTTLSVVTMPVLSYKKYRVSKIINSRALAADSKETLVCALLSAAVAAGLLLNYLFGLWWADPVSALLITVFIIREGLRGVF